MIIPAVLAGERYSNHRHKRAKIWRQAVFYRPPSQQWEQALEIFVGHCRTLPRPFTRPDQQDGERHLSRRTVSVVQWKRRRVGVSELSRGGFSRYRRLYQLGQMTKGNQMNDLNCSLGVDLKRQPTSDGRATPQSRLASQAKTGGEKRHFLSPNWSHVTNHVPIRRGQSESRIRRGLPTK